MNGCKNNILLKSNGRDGFYILNTDRGELLCHRITDGAISRQSDILFFGHPSDSDTVIDEDDILHIVFCDNDGSIVYMRNTSEKWIRGYLLRAKENSDIRPNSFFVNNYKNEIFVVYTIGQQDNKIVCCQTIGNRIERPVALDRICAESDSIFALQDLKGSILVFYTDREQRFGYKRYSRKDGSWSAFVCIDESGKQVRQIYACCDKDNVYLCYKISGCIRFRCITSADGRASAEQMLTRKHVESCSNPVLFCKDKKIRLMWSDRRRVVSSDAEKGAYIWSRIEEKKLADTGQIVLFKLCDAYSGVAEHNFGYIRNDRIRIWNGDEYIDFISGEKKSECSEKPIENSYSEQHLQNPKMNIEKERAYIMKEMGIPSRKENPTNGFREVDANESDTDKPSESKSKVELQCSDSLSDEILKELKDLAKMMEKLKNDVETIKSVIKTNVIKEPNKANKKRISVKVHKK